MRKLLVAAFAVLPALRATGPTYPTRQISAIVPASAGGPTDTIGRHRDGARSAGLGQTVIIENVGGASVRLRPVAWRAPILTAIR